MRAIVRKTWEKITATGRPSDNGETFVMVDNADETKVYDPDDLITSGRVIGDFEGYAAMDRDGVVSLFFDKPKKDRFCGIWRGQRIGKINKSFDKGYILSWDNAEPVRFKMSISLTTELFTPKKKKKKNGGKE